MPLMQPEVIIVPDFEALSRAAAEAIVRQIADTRQKKDFFSIALSGGSTPKGLYSLLATDGSFRDKLYWNKMYFFWGDERHVPPDHPDSNYRMASDALLSKVPVPRENIHRMQTENPAASKVADEYEKEIRKCFKLKPGRVPKFDCVLLGMGSDGHIASLFPRTEAVQEKKRLVVANWVEKLQTHRITLTFPVLNNADFIIFLVSGEDKAEMVRKVLQDRGRADRYPAQLIQPTHGKLLWLVDRAAARFLTREA